MPMNQHKVLQQFTASYCFIMWWKERRKKNSEVFLLFLVNLRLYVQSLVWSLWCTFLFFLSFIVVLLLLLCVRMTRFLVRSGAFSLSPHCSHSVFYSSSNFIAPSHRHTHIYNTNCRRNIDRKTSHRHEKVKENVNKRGQKVDEPDRKRDWTQLIYVNIHVSMLAREKEERSIE